jgi:hypothetical protein
MQPFPIPLRRPLTRPQKPDCLRETQLGVVKSRSFRQMHEF